MSTTYNIWDGTCGNISGSTNFGFYDSDSEFQADGPKVANFCARKLGYPIVEVELDSGSFFTSFEEAITEYSAQVNQFNIKDNLLAVRGVSTDTNLTHKNIAQNLGPIIQIAEGYGTEADLYSNVDWHTGSIDIVDGTQVYDIDTLYTDVYESGSTISIRKIHHYTPPAIVKFFDPYAGTATGTYSMMSEFGFDNMSPASSFLLMPMFEDVLRVQAIEFNDMIRKSAYSFNLYNNKLQIFPVPTSNFELWFEYFIKEDRDNVSSVYPSGSMTDLSNVTYDNMEYSNINDVGKQWIRRYAHAVSMEKLGHIRRKYGSIPVPGSELDLDGADLISDAVAIKEELMTQLREMLEQTSRKALLEAKAEEAENLSNTLKNVPRPIYIG